MADEIKPQTPTTQPNMVESAKLQADRLEAVNREIAVKLARLEELKAFETLGGKSEGAPQQTQPQEVSPKDYAKLVLSGKLPIKK